MSDRPLLKPFQVVGGSDKNAVSGDMSAPIISRVTILNGMTRFSYQINWAGTAPAGTVSFQVSDDYSQDATGQVKNPGTWNEMILSGPTVVSGNTGMGFLDAVDCSAYAVRFVYTPLGGTGNMNAFVTAKVA